MTLAVKVWGDFACFTRPELKVERVTYPVMTPSAARGILEAIFWKPECAWRVREIHVLEPVAYMSLVRNEIRRRQSDRTAQDWARTGGGYDASSDREQRHTLALRKVSYLIHADLVIRDNPRADAAKYRDQFRRRLARGQCFATPYLGTREFSAFFAPPDGTERAIDVTESLGRMLFDLKFGGKAGAEPIFFDAALEHGVMRIPEYLHVPESPGRGGVTTCC